MALLALMRYLSKANGVFHVLKNGDFTKCLSWLVIVFTGGHVTDYGPINDSVCHLPSEMVLLVLAIIVIY